MKKGFVALVLLGMFFLLGATASAAEITFTVPGKNVVRQVQNCTFNCTAVQYINLGNPIRNWRVMSIGPQTVCEGQNATVDFPEAEEVGLAVVVVNGTDTTEICDLFRRPWDVGLLDRFLRAHPPLGSACFPNNSTLTIQACAAPGESFSALILLESDQCDYTLLGPILINDANDCGVAEPVPTVNAFGGAALMVLLVASSILYIRRRKALR